MVTVNELIAQVRAEAEAQPDKVYKIPPHSVGGDSHPQCLYTHEDGSPGCIVGAALASLGIVIGYADECNEVGVWALMRDHDSISCGHYDTPEVCWLEYAQESQDAGMSWSRAVRSADARFSLPA